MADTDMTYHDVLIVTRSLLPSFHPSIDICRPLFPLHLLYLVQLPLVPCSAMSMKLRELIRAVRACKTAAEERAVISRENAMIRTSFKEDSPYRHRNVAKLLYIHMLGYPTHHGQLEALKLIAGGNFPEKRIGYLGLMLLLDERQEVLMLVTNSLEKDMDSRNPYIVGLALCSLGNICSAEMARDLCSKVETFFRHQSAYIRKKAALCATRIIRKVPELREQFEKSVLLLLNDKNHAVLLTAVTLIIEMCKIDESVIKRYRKPVVPVLVRLLKNLVLAGYVSEYDVAGITDPFLQSKLIQLLRILGTGNTEASEFMYEILAQVAINTEPTKNPGNVILYECVQTIMAIEADTSSRVLAINILGRFLANRDNNIRYVALASLCKCVGRDTAAVQRHRNTIVECLKDLDVSIRRRALDLIYALVTKSNVKTLAKELLTYLALTTGDSEFKTDLTEKIVVVVDRFAPTKHWHVETIIAVLTTAGSLTKENVATDLILLILKNPTLHPYAVFKLFFAIRNGTPHLPLIHVALWCIGEYGDYLVSSDGVTRAREVDDTLPQQPVTEQDVLDVLRSVSHNKDATLLTKEYLLMALIKLSSRLQSAEVRSELTALVATYESSRHVELQQRSVEYVQLSAEDKTKLRNGLVGRMPVPTKPTKKQRENEAKEQEEERKKAAREKSSGKKKKKKVETSEEEEEEESEVESEESEEGSEEEETEEEEEEDDETKKKQAEVPKPNGKVVKKSGAKQQQNLFDTDFFARNAATSTSPTPSVPFSQSPTPRPAVTVDLLSDIFGSAAATAAMQRPPPQAADLDPFAALNATSPTAASQPLSTAAQPAATQPSAGAGFFPSAAAASPAAASANSQTFPPATVFDKDGLSITFLYSRNPATPATLNVTALFSNRTAAEFTAFDFQVAVAKNAVTLTMQPASSSVVPPSSEQRVRQELVLHNSMYGQKKLVIRVRISYTTDGRQVVETATIGQFPD